MAKFVAVVMGLFLVVAVQPSHAQGAISCPTTLTDTVVVYPHAPSSRDSA